MYRSSRHYIIYSALISLLQGWELNLVVIVKVKVGMEEKEVVIIIIKELVIGIYTLELNLFRLMARVSYRRVCR